MCVNVGIYLSRVDLVLGLSSFPFSFLFSLPNSWVRAQSGEGPRLTEKNQSGRSVNPYVERKLIDGPEQYLGPFETFP